MDESSERILLSRRSLLTAGGAAAGTLWVAPLVLGVGMSSAQAASGPPERARPAPPRGPGDNRARDSGNNPGRRRGQD